MLISYQPIVLSIEIYNLYYLDYIPPCSMVLPLIIIHENDDIECILMYLMYD